MLSSSRRATWPFLLLALCVLSAHGQTFSTAQNGSWTEPSTWQGGIVPGGINTEIIQINHQVDIPALADVSVYRAIINGELRVESNATLSLYDGDEITDLSVVGSLVVAGTFIQENGAVLEGTNTFNTNFLSGARYRYRWVDAGNLPVVNWDSESTFLVEGFNTNVSITSDSWNQHFGNFIYDCPAQGSFMDFNGRLTHVQGALIIRNTNGNILRLARSHAMNLSVGGDFTIEGRSEVWLGESSNNLNVSIGGDFIFKSTSTASSYLTLDGQTTIEVHGDVIIDTSYKLKFTSASGGGNAVLAVGGNFSFLQGTIDAMGDGKGSIVFDGEDRQTYLRSEGTVSEGNFDFEIAAGAEVDLGTSLLSNTLSGSVVVYGKLNVGSPNAMGALQGGPGGNIDVMGSVVFVDDAVLEYNGVFSQYLGYHPDGEAITTIINNNTGVTLLENIAVGSLNIESGLLNCGVHTLSVANQIYVGEAGSLTSAGTIQCTTDGLQEIDVNGSTLHNLFIQGSNKEVYLLSPMQVTGLISFGGTGSTFNTQNFLTLISSSVSGAGNGQVGHLINGNRITGNVTVQRYMDPGRVYRYLASPVKNATVNHLQDDFPVTGPFSDASTGPGITTANPSLFYYDEASTAGWMNYPPSGSASAYTLTPGEGYAAFIREQNEAVTWDVTGEINQGEIALPVTYTSGQDEMDGWNLVGNPYPCAIAWNNTGWIKQQISTGIAVRDNLNGRVRVWDGGIGDLAGGYIAAGQAFWVRSIGDDAQLVVDEPAKHIGENVYFYRNDDEEIDYVELTIRNNEAYDKAYLRLRPASIPDIDAHDIPKLQNDLLNISLLTPAGKSLSLYAVESIPCTFEVPVFFESNKTESLQIDLKPYGKFLHADVRLVNKTTGIALQRNEAGVYIVDTNVKTAWMLRVVSAPGSEIQFKLPETMCAEHAVNVLITEVEEEKEYLLYRRKDGFSMALTDRSKGIFTLPPSAIFESDYTIYSKSACAIDSIHLTLSEKRPDAPQADDQARCGDGKITLSARGAYSHQTYVWLTDDMETLLGENQKFTTPYLYKSESYVVCIRDTLTGCLSPAAKVNAQIEAPATLTIRHENNKLYVSSPPPNEWYFEGIRLPDSTEYLIPTLKGLYSVRKTGACTSETHYNYQKLSKNAVLVYPNPVAGYARYPVDNGDVILNDIITINGVSVFYLCKLDCSESECRLDISALKTGIYFLIFNIKGTIARTSLSVY